MKYLMNLRHSASFLSLKLRTLRPLLKLLVRVGQRMDREITVAALEYGTVTGQLQAGLMAGGDNIRIDPAKHKKKQP